MTDKLRFGIVGCGVIGSTHAEAISSLPDAQLVAVCDPVAERAQKLADKYGVTPYTDLQEMLDREWLDVVDICTPSGLHGEQACQVMRSGQHVIVEKPIEISLPAIKEMLRVQRENSASIHRCNDATRLGTNPSHQRRCAATATQSGEMKGEPLRGQQRCKEHVKLAVISQHRFDVAALQVHKLVEEQAFGRLVLGNVIVPWWRSQAYYDSGAWRGTWSLDGGGILMNQSIHSIDLLQWFMGPVRSVYAYTDTLVHHIETEDVAVAVLRFASGALGTIAATTGAYPGVTTRVEVFGDKGSAIIEDDRLAYLHLARDDREEVGAYGANIPKVAVPPDIADVQIGDGGSTAQNPAALSAQGHAIQIADMIRAIQENGTPVVDGEAARHPVEIILGIYESARTHKEVMLS